MRTLLILLISLSVNLTATSQNAISDTLTRAEKDSIVALLPRINTELRDYDLLKQKMYIQFETINALQEKSRTQQALNVRKEIKLDTYATSIINLQATTFTLTNDLVKTKRQRFYARLENWFWRGGAIFLAGKLLKLY